MIAIEEKKRISLVTFSSIINNLFNQCLINDAIVLSGP